MERWMKEKMRGKAKGGSPFDVPGWFVAGSAMKFLGTSRFSSISYNLISRFVLIIKWNDWFYKSILEWSLTRSILYTWIRNYFLFFFYDSITNSFHLSPIFFILIQNRYFILILISVCVCMYHDKLNSFDIFHVFKKRFTTFHFLCENFDIRKNIFHQIESVIFLRNKFSFLCFFIFFKKFVVWTRR